jgi:hypothetical protein
MFRQQARQLCEQAKGVRDEADKRHLMELATTYRRTADQMAPPTSEQEARP